MAGRTAGSAPPPLTPECVAYCFLFKQEPTHWCEWWSAHFREDASGQRPTVLVHTKRPPRSPLGCRHAIRRGRTLRTAWGRPSLVRAALQLFREALECDAVRVLCLLSDACIPLHSPRASVEWLDTETESGALSLLDGHARAPELCSAYPLDATPHGQFLVLTRCAAESVLRESEQLLVPFMLGGAFPAHLCADEHFFGYALDSLSLAWKTLTVTHSVWSSTEASHPVTHSSWDTLSTELRRVAALPCAPLFLRKVDMQRVLPPAESGSSAAARVSLDGLPTERRAEPSSRAAFSSPRHGAPHRHVRESCSQDEEDRTPRHSPLG